ncbi:hypothetical protein AGMMS49587_05550 [Spirochaetia bacterium]|nr:hypothetical protein AGMMS49587_05550 [Spirochaetia bacterium]
MTLSVIFSGASLVLCGFFFIYFTLYIKRRTDRANILEDYQDEAIEIKAEINAVTDRNLTLVEDRITALKQLLEDVDKRIAVLNREQDRKGRSDAVYSSLGRQMKVTVREPPSSVPADREGTGSPPESAAEPERRGSPPEPAPPADTAAAVAAPVTYPLGETAAPAGTVFIDREAEKKESKVSFAERVMELFRAGFAPDLIAARLGVSISEVELAIAVSRRKG